MHTNKPNGDTEILRLLREPDSQEQAFRLLMQRYGENIYWHIRRIVVGHEDAEDVLQDTSINIFRNIRQFSGDATQLKAWIYRIATTTALMHLRQRTHLFQSIDSLNPSLLETMASENHINMDKVEYRLQEILLTLPTQQRLVFNMRYYDDLSYEEISHITGKNPKTLMANYHFARKKIEAELKSLTL